jgi:two-component system, repressor protein LuxO
MKATTTPARRARTNVLLVEDTSSLQMIYRSVLMAAGFAVRVASNAAQAMSALREAAVDVIVLDLVLPDRDGLSLMQDMLALRADTAVIVVTANGSINKAVEAMRLGAHEFLVKPVDDARLVAAIGNATPRIAQRPTAPQLLPTNATFIGTSDVMHRLHGKIASVAGSMATVFITGESGTGKELCALAVHDTSPRAAGPFIALNCGAIPQDLLESEVFGHMKGSFTGAISDKPGAATAADGGTLFLDEICEMALPLQTKLLRFLQTSTVQPVGATRPRKVNVRIICATNIDPMEAVRRGQFREDLYYRLFVVPIHMPPLRARGEDVIEIAEAALARFSAEEGRDFTGLDTQVKTLFRKHPWPGNVRQVLNVIRNVVVLNDGGVVHLDMLPDDLRDAPVVAGAAPDTAVNGTGVDGLVGKPLADIERLVIAATLDRFGGSVPKAARVLEISPSTLYRKLEAWGGTA